MTRTVALLAMAALMAAIPASGSTPARPAFMEGHPFAYEGVVGGLHAWSLPDSEELWMVLPDGQTVVAGYLFSRTGHDIGSAILGLDPVHAFEILGPQADPTDRSGSGPTSPEALQALIPEAIEHAAPGLVATDEAGRNALVAELVAAMAAAETPEAFRMAVLDWQARVAGRDASTTAEEATDALKDTGSDAGPALAGRSVRPPEATDAPGADAPRAAGSDIDLLEDIRNLFWFSVGESTAPAVYMFYDPICPHCARTIRNLEPRIRSGDLQLRIILTPLLSEESLALASGILGSDDPVSAFMENALGLARFGRSPVAPGTIEDLDPGFLSGIEVNVDFLQDNGIRGVPFMAWNTVNGPRFLSGVPARDYAFGAIVDPWPGSR